MANRLFSKFIHAKEERNAPPSANHWFSTAKPRSSHVYLSLVLKPPPLVPPFLLVKSLSSKLKVARCQLASLAIRINTFSVKFNELHPPVVKQ